MTTKENGPVLQPQARAPSLGGWAIDERADMNALGPVKDEVAEAPEGEPKALSQYLGRWLELYRRHQEGIGPRGFEEGVPQGHVHEGAGALSTDSRLVSHVLPPDFSMSDCEETDGNLR